MLSQRLVPVVILNQLSHAQPLAEALLAAGLNVIELTLRTDCALDALKLLKHKFPTLHLGAGTVLDPHLVPQLADLGTNFAVSPGLNPAVIAACQKAQLPIFPGVANPTDIEAARALGLQTLKFFPAEPLGGASMLKALIGPYGHTGIRFIPTGGINAEKAPSYAALPEVAAIGGSWFVSPKLIAEGNWSAITSLTQQALALTSNTP